VAWAAAAQSKHAARHVRWDALRTCDTVCAVLAVNALVGKRGSRHTSPCLGRRQWQLQKVTLRVIFSAPSALTRHAGNQLSQRLHT
jgi:hypothetical protein